MSKVTKQPGRGGARKGSGRKPAEDPKVAITIYVEGSLVTAMGGVEAVREECYTFLKSKLDK
jgi:hypothetical protein